MKSLDFLKEGFMEDASEAHQDHEVQMARQECFHAAEHALALHKLLRNISEAQGLEGWVSSKITLANDYLKRVREYLEYELLTKDINDEAPTLTIAEDQESKKKNLVVEYKVSGAEPGSENYTINDIDLNALQNVTSRYYDRPVTIAQSKDNPDLYTINVAMTVGPVDYGSYNAATRTASVAKRMTDKGDQLQKVLKGIAEGQSEEERAESERQMQDFLSKGGEIRQVRANRGPRRSGASLASHHIGGMGDARTGRRSQMRGLGSNPTGKLLVAKESEGVAEGLPGSLSKSDYTPGKTTKHTNTNCTTCHGRKSMYKVGGKLFPDNKQGATKVKCPTCKGTGDKQGVAEGIRDDAMAGLQKTVDFAKQHGYKIYRSPTGRKIRFVNKELEHEIRAQVDNYGDSINVNFMDYYTGTSGNDDASYFDQVFKDAYEQALGDYENRRSDDDVGLYTRSQLQQKQGVGVAEGSYYPGEHGPEGVAIVDKTRQRGKPGGTYWAGSEGPDGIAIDDPNDVMPDKKPVAKKLGPKAKAKTQMLKMYGDGEITFRKTSNGGYFIQHEDDFGDTHSHQYDPKTGKVDFSGVTRSTYSGKGVAEGLAPGQAAWKQEMIANGAVKFQRDKHGGGAVDRIVAYNKDGKVVGGFNRKGVAEGIFDFKKQSMPEDGDELKIDDRHVMFDDGGSYYGATWIKKDGSEAYEEFDKSEYTNLKELKKAISDAIKDQDQQGVAEGIEDTVRVYGNKHGYYVWTPNSNIMAFSLDGEMVGDWGNYDSDEAKLKVANAVKMQPIPFSVLPDQVKRIIGRKLFNQGVAGRNVYFKNAPTPKLGEEKSAKCNQTMEGKSCPVHGLQECPGMKARALAEWRKAERAKRQMNSVTETTAGSVAGVVNAPIKNKSKVGTLFGGTYKQKKVKEAKQMTFPGENTKPPQRPGDQVRGTEKATKPNPFKHRLVGNE